MRFVLGVIVGVLLTAGVAYAVDRTHGRAGADPVEARRMVNWGAVGADLDDASVGIHNAWTDLVGRSRQADKTDAGKDNAGKDSVGKSDAVKTDGSGKPGG